MSVRMRLAVLAGLLGFRRAVSRADGTAQRTASRLRPPAPQPQPAERSAKR